MTTAAPVPAHPQREVRELEHVWIPMSDGVRLAARIWLPVDADINPVPALFEYLPYRKNDGTLQRDQVRQPQLAAHGYAVARVDLRGSGDSEGLLLDEYLPQELDDACEVIAWLAEQPWCTGKVGMAGISWGGFNALQVAALRPPALEAIISVCSTDDRYADDVHYHGGCVVASEMLPWASTMLYAGGRPPDPAHFGDGWREAWLERIDVRPFVEAWLSHQRRDEYWKHGSVVEDYDAMDCAVYMVGGWDDAYRDAVLRVLAGYSGPRKGLIGPWGHVYPDLGSPGAPIDFIAESVRFWDHWLKGVDTGVMDEPMLRVFLRETAGEPPEPTERVGEWAAEPSWPSPTVAEERWRLDPDSRLRPEDDAPPTDAAGDDEHALLGSQAAGLEAGTYMASGAIEDLPGDQRREDGLALTYTSTPLEEAVTTLGQAEAHLTVAVDRPLALVAVRLTEVTPAGASRLVARGLLNLTHRHGHETPEPMTPGEATSVTVRLSAAGHTVRAGSRIRVAVSPTYWPWAWPSPEPVTLTLFAGADSLVTLPVREPRDDDGVEPAFVLGEVGEPTGPRRGGHPQITHDRITGRWEVHVRSDRDPVSLPDGLVLDESRLDVLSIVDGDPLSAEVRCERSSEVHRGDWRIRVETVSTMSSDATTFRVTNALDAYEGETRVAARRWQRDIPRDHV
jgi:uncharacterized protein